MVAAAGRYLVGQVAVRALHLVAQEAVPPRQALVVVRQEQTLVRVAAPTNSSVGPSPPGPALAALVGVLQALRPEVALTVPGLESLAPAEVLTVPGLEGGPEARAARGRRCRAAAAVVPLPQLPVAAEAVVLPQVAAALAVKRPRGVQAMEAGHQRVAALASK